MTNLSDSEGFTELSALEFEADAVLPELILLTSLILRSPEHFVQPLAASPEYKSLERRKRNIWLEPLIPNLLNGKRELFYTEFLPQNFLLPDVCFNCSTSFGLTLSGRVRTACPHCVLHTNQIISFLQLEDELGVFWIPTHLSDLLISQLLYKYYSPQGDKSWQLSLPSLIS